jgi:hypothetical protein
VTVLFADLRGSMELLAYYEQALVALEHVPDSRATTAWASCIARPAVVNWPELSYQRLLRYIAPWTWPSGCPISRQRSYSNSR